MHSTRTIRPPCLAGALAAAAFLAVALPVHAQTAVSLDSLLNTRINAASRYDQTAAEAPASVTIVTAEDIERFGWRDLREILEAVRGFYASDDRNYTYIGTRGFSRPTDYNNRARLLVDGHVLNEQVWGGAPLGTDLPIALEAIERIEVVRGPGSAVHGSSAMFAVINIVTRTGAALDGVLAGARVGSGDTRRVSFAAGRPLGARSAFSLSAVHQRSAGGTLYFPEFDHPSTNAGIASGLDWERATGALGAFTWRDLTARAGFRTRRKGIPTAPYDGPFGDPGVFTLDETSWGELAWRHHGHGQHEYRARVYVDHYTYSGVWSTDPASANSDQGGSTDVGAEFTFIRDFTSAHRLTMGATVRDVLRAEYGEVLTDGSRTHDDAPFVRVAAWVQDEFQFPRAVTLFTGLRVDKRSRFSAAVSPRVAVLWTPRPATVVKLLYGEAFRSPSAAEAEIETSFYVENPTLRPERVRTTELALQRRVGPAVLLNGSVFHYRIRDLIEQAEITAGGELHYANLSAATARGAEVELDARPAGPLAGRMAYTYQRTRDGMTGGRLTNSPEHVGTASVTLRTGGLGSTVAGRYESSRRTIGGEMTDGFFRTDLTLRYAPRTPLFARMRDPGSLTLRVTNLLDVAYAAPAGLEHRQVTLPQDGRMITLGISAAFR